MSCSWLSYQLQNILIHMTNYFVIILFCPYVLVPLSLINEVVLNWIGSVWMKDSIPSSAGAEGRVIYHFSRQSGDESSRSFSETRQLPFLPDLLRQSCTLTPTLGTKKIIISSFQLETVSQSVHSIFLPAPFIPGSIPRSLLRARWQWRLAHWIVTRTAEIIRHPV